MKKHAVFCLLIALVVGASSLFANEDNPLGKIKKVKQEKADKLGVMLIEEGSDIKKLLKKGANPNVVLSAEQSETIQGNETPFMAFLSGGDFETAKLMTYANADADYVTTDGVPLIIHYLNKENLEVANFLYFECKAKVPADTILYKDLNFPALVAQNGGIEILKDLQSKGRDILKTYTVSSSDTTASFNLISVVMYHDRNETLSDERRELFDWLIEQKIDVNVPMKMIANTQESIEAYPLAIAIISNEFDMLKTLVENGARLDVNTVIDEQSMKMNMNIITITLMNMQTEMMAFLLEKGADPNGEMTVESGDSLIAKIPALVFAAKMKKVKMAKLLKESGADLSREIKTAAELGIDGHGATDVMSFIAKNGEDEIQELFKEEIALWKKEQESPETDSLSTPK